MRYAAKVDWWIGCCIAAALLLPAVSAVETRSLWAAGAALAAWVIVFGFCYPQSYETTAEALVIRAGLSRRTIPYSSITAVRPSSDTRSSLALSLDRVEIEYASGSLLIAPKDQEAFFADLAARSPQLSRSGQDLAVTLT